MRFDSLQIENYRQYEHITFDFPQTFETDLHIIVASNGVGKTNMLNAINWCLYGYEPHLEDAEDSLTICNHAALEGAKLKGDKTSTVTIKIKATAEDKHFVFSRSVDVTVFSFFPGIQRFKVFITDSSGSTTIAENDEATDIINHYLPRKIRQYFFFDGEQLHNYFGKAHDNSHVKDSIHEIAQVSVLTNARLHLEAIIKGEYQKAIATLSPKVDELTKKRDDKIDLREKVVSDIDALEKSIADSEDTISDLNTKIAGTETVVDDNKRYLANQAEIAKLEDESKALNDKLKALVRKYLLLLYMYDVNYATSTYIQAKVDKGVLPPDINIDIAKASLVKHKCLICDGELNTKTESYLKSLIEKYEVSTVVSHKLVEIKNDVNRAINEAQNYAKEKKAIFDRISEVGILINKLTLENEDLYKKISVCSSVETIALWMEQRLEHQKLVKINSTKIGSYKNQVKTLNDEIAVIQAQIDQAISENKKCDELKGYLAFASRSLQIVSQIEQEMVGEVRKRMEIETFTRFENLIWRKNTYGHIELNADYKLRLFHKVTGESCLGSCSAAERELLALAFTIALHKVSGHNSPLFIDTPVGRVSDINRENFARALIEVSKSKQLILAFTPSEFSDEIKKYFDPTVLSSMNRLLSDESSTTKEGNYNG